MSSIIQNKLNGKMAESYAISDLRKNGFTVIRFTKCDFIALNRIINWFIEVKYNKSRLSKNQKKFRSFCRRRKLNFLVYRVTPAQLEESRKH